MHGKCGRLVRNVPVVLISSNLLANGRARVHGDSGVGWFVVGVCVAAGRVRCCAARSKRETEVSEQTTSIVERYGIACQGRKACIQCGCPKDPVNAPQERTRIPVRCERETSSGAAQPVVGRTSEQEVHHVFDEGRGRNAPQKVEPLRLLPRDGCCA